MLRYQSLIEALEAAPDDLEFVTHWVDEDDRATVTFAEFRRRARAQAFLFREHGLGKGDCVALIMPQTIAAMTAFAGAMMLGAVAAFLAYPNFKVEPSKYRSGLAGVTANLGAKLVVIDELFPEELLEHIVVGDGVNVLRAMRDTESVDGFRAANASLNDLAFIQHSAGTTGLQKGVALTHGAVLRQIAHLANALKIDSSRDRIYSWLPLYHDMGLIACFVLPMVCHVPVVMQSPLEWVMQPESMLQVITDCRCTLSWMPNFAFQFVPRRTPQNRWRDYDLSSLRALINCSEPVRASSMQEFADAFAPIGLKESALQSSYAMAENVFAVTQSEGTPSQVWTDARIFRNEHRVQALSAESADAIPFASSGKVLPGNEICLVDEARKDLAKGCVGEILVRSDSLFDGYYNRPDLTASAIIGGWYYTGDLGFLHEDELYVVGRKKDVLIVGGENIYPQDIEAIVETHPAIREGRSIALGVFDRDLGTEQIVVVAEVRNEQALEEVTFLEHEIRKNVVAGAGIAVSRILLKPPQWIVKSTAGKAARSSTREKLLQEHPELKFDR